MPWCLRRVDEAIAQLKALGARIEEVKVADASSSHHRQRGDLLQRILGGATRTHAAWVLENGAAQRRARIYLGLLTDSADYIQAQRIRSRCRAELAQVFGRSIAWPCRTKPGRRRGSKMSGRSTRSSSMCVPEFHGPFNLTGLPTLSVPCGFSENNLPIALQIVGRPFRRSHGAARRLHLSAADEVVRKAAGDLKNSGGR